MSGHSKFANIAHKKAANDAAKGKIFTRLGKEIMVAVKEGGPDVNNNSKLRQVVTKCKAANMPNDTIDRAIKKAASTDMSDFESVTYEGYGPNGTAIIVEALTDNRNRAASNEGVTFASAEVTMIPQTMVELTSEDDIKKMRRILALLDEEDDVQNVYHNWDEPVEDEE